ncbi:MAG: NrfD/PsrC family molybdoenzyme membrane anchor subunit [Candidatus Eisenbacteria bacterium]
MARRRPVEEREAEQVDTFLAPGHTILSVTAKIAGVVLQRGTPRGWWIGAGIAFLLVMGLTTAVTVLFVRGVGVWGIDIPVAWGFAIVNFVWWIGIGHAGTLISAILLLMRQTWRTSINRFAEAITLFAVAQAALFPILHLGRPWFFFWLIPYPTTFGVWPQFRSPLVWDFFAVSTYATVSLLFWYIGMLPDLATMRDRARHRVVRFFYGLGALGWRNAASHWSRYETIYLLVAALATPLVVSVHTIVSFDFAVSLLPGWHSTIFPPYFVAGALFSGFAMVLTVTIPVRKYYRLEDMITVEHLDNMAKLMLASGLIVAYGYANELFMAWYSANRFERFLVENRALGPYGPAFWMMMLCNVGVAQALWWPRVRRSVGLLFLVSLLINTGMWLERYVIVITSLHRDFLPSSWGLYKPTIWDWMTFAGTLGMFAFLMFLFLRFLPMISMSEMRDLVTRQREGKEPA